MPSTSATDVDRRRGGRPSTHAPTVFDLDDLEVYYGAFRAVREVT